MTHKERDRPLQIQAEEMDGDASLYSAIGDRYLFDLSILLLLYLL